VSRYRLIVGGSSYAGSRSVQQDAFGVSDTSLFDEKGVLAVVSDGIGGMSNGEKFSRIAVDTMKTSFAGATAQNDICSSLLTIYGDARRAAMSALEDTENPEGGATVVAVLVKDNKMAFLSVGDSSIFFMRRGGLIKLNRPQILGVMLDESAAFGYVPREEAERNIYRKALTNHICEYEVKNCDRNLSPITLRAGDRIALLSDGVTSTLSEGEIAACMRMNGVGGAKAMIEKIISRGKPRQDNATALMLTIVKLRKEKEAETDG